MAESRVRIGMLALFLTLVAVSTWQRGVFTRTHATFPIFRQSFVHLRAGQDLYARYPTEQGPRDDDRFKYAPSAAVFLAPLAALPFVPALFLWTALNALALFFAVGRLLPGRDGTTALLIIFPALIPAIQSTSSNALIAALLVLSYLALERHHVERASLAIAAGTLMKLYPVAVMPFLLTQPRPRRALAIVALAFAGLIALPLLVTSPGELLTQYRSWMAVLFADERDLSFARSIMVTVRTWTGTAGTNWAYQLAATMLLVTPLAVRRAAWADSAFRRSLLASLLIYVVIFNHQAENASYVVAAVGLALWFVSAKRTWPRVALLALCLVGLEAVPYTLVWLWMQFDLLEVQRVWARLRALRPAPAAGITVTTRVPRAIQSASVPEALEV